MWTAATFRRSLQNALSYGARRETLGRSVARSGIISWRKTGEKDDGLERWEEARGCCGVWRVALGSSSCVWLKIPVLTQRLSVVPSGASVRRGRGVKLWDAAELAASGGRAPSSGRVPSLSCSGMSSRGAQREKRWDTSRSHRVKRQKGGGVGV